MATVTWSPPVELREMLEGVSERVGDASPVMQVIALDMEDYVENVMFATAGEGEWEPLSQATIDRHGPHDVLRLTGLMKAVTGRDWSARNAVVINTAPHAHFAVGGVRRYHETKYTKTRVNKDGKTVTVRRGEAELRAMAQRPEWAGRQHSPARDFMLLSDQRTEDLYGPMILDFMFSEL